MRLINQMLYFAYGSNMDLRQMRRRCPSYRFVSIAKLEDHKLAFTRRSPRRRCGVADVIPSPGEEVWGVLYNIKTRRDVLALDRAEGYKAGRKRVNGYDRELRKVWSPLFPRKRECHGGSRHRIRFRRDELAARGR